MSALPQRTRRPAALAGVVVVAFAAELAVLVALWIQLVGRGGLCGTEYTPELEVWSPRDRACTAAWVDAASFGLLAVVPLVLGIGLAWQVRPRRLALVLVAAAVLACVGELGVASVIEAQSPRR